RDAGHEVLIELPMEGYGGNQKALGAAALLTSRSAEENLQRLDWLLSRFGGYFAATNYMGAKFSAEPAALKPVLDKLRDAGVAYIDDTGAARTSAQSAAVAWTSVNRMIPPAPTERARSAVRQELAALEQIAARDGAALGKTYAYAATLDEIVDWAQSLENKSVVPAPASALLRTNAATR
ncbi:MAG: divergent polysaccharide deacetylase family protein, partial [Hyphococcus sp.]